MTHTDDEPKYTQHTYKELFPTKSKLYVRKYKRRNTETDFDVPASGHADWREELERFLIGQGTNGVKQTLITVRMTAWAEAKEVTDYLETLWLEGKVQKFKIKHATIWRATNLIMED